MVDYNGHRLTFKKAFTRTLYKVFSSFLYIGFIMIAITRRKQLLHEILSKCLIINR